MRRVALLITYTMLEPIVGGAFFRALRLAVELRRRGWSPVICNHGPMLEDPKITDARSAQVTLIQLDREAPGFNVERAVVQFAGFEPSVVIMGESPFELMKVFYEGARRLSCPLVVFDQYYRPSLVPPRASADLILLYCLQTFWEGIQPIGSPYRLIPPFIEDVTPPEALPLAADFPLTNRITCIAYEESILRLGIQLVAGLRREDVSFIVISPQPDRAAELLRDVNLNGCATANLPMQPDAVVFGCIESSRVSILSNGFIQVMDALALGCPVITLKRDNNVGLNELNYDTRFHPFMSFDESETAQRARIERWLKCSPFSPDLVVKLKRERNGTATCADLIETLVSLPREKPHQTWLQRLVHTLSLRAQG